MGPREIDPSGGSEYQEPTGQEARDLLAEVIESRAEASLGNGIGAAPVGNSAHRILALQDDHLVLVDIGQDAAGVRIALVVDVDDRALWNGGPLTEMLGTGYWDPYDGTPEDWSVVLPLLESFDGDLDGWEAWLDAEMDRADPGGTPT